MCLSIPSQLLEDVIYSLDEDLLFVLLKTNEVLVCTARVNPCSAMELWNPSLQTKIHTIAKVVVRDLDRMSQCVHVCV